MNVFFHGKVDAGFDVLKNKIETDMAGPMGEWVTEYRIADLGGELSGQASTNFVFGKQDFGSLCEVSRFLVP